MIKGKTGLIPRYNWDYGLLDLARAFAGIFSGASKDEQTLEQVFGCKPILTTSGRTSLFAILKSLGLPGGSFVGVPLFCCSAVFDAIRRADLVPKFIDINLTDYNLSASDLKKKGDRLSAVVIVHMFGHPADMDAVSSVCGGIPIVEDCAQSLFSKYKGHYTGFQSTASFFSFSAGKYISAGGGSAIFCKDPLLRSSMARLVEMFQDWRPIQQALHCAAIYGKALCYTRPWYGILGYPIGRRLDPRLDLTGKYVFQLRRIAKSDLRIISRRIQSFAPRVAKQRQNALYLLDRLSTLGIILPMETERCVSNYYQFAVRFEDTKQRDLVAQYLLQRNIDTAKYLDDIVDTAKQSYGYGGDCPDAELCSKTVLVIPNHYTLSIQDLDHIVHTLKEATTSLGDSLNLRIRPMSIAQTR